MRVHVRGGREDQFGQKDGKEHVGEQGEVLSHSSCQRLTPEAVRQQTTTEVQRTQLLRPSRI